MWLSIWLASYFSPNSQFSQRNFSPRNCTLNYSRSFKTFLWICDRAVKYMRCKSDAWMKMALTCHLKKYLHQLFPFWDPESGCMTKCIRLWMKPSTNRKTKNDAISGKYLLTFTILWSALQLKWVEIYIQNVISLFLISTILGVQIHLGFKI